jgi:hypothetical protein
MTRKDFELIAKAIKSAVDYEQTFEDSNTGTRSIAGVAFNLADALADTNDRFDRAKFLKACGVQG